MGGVPQREPHRAKRRVVPLLVVSPRGTERAPGFFFYPESAVESHRNAPRARFGVQPAPRRVPKRPAGAFLLPSRAVPESSRTNIVRRRRSGVQRDSSRPPKGPRGPFWSPASLFAPLPTPERPFFRDRRAKRAKTGLRNAAGAADRCQTFPTVADDEPRTRLLSPTVADERAAPGEERR